MAEFYRPLPYSVEFEGKTYALTPAFDNVLNMYEVTEKCGMRERTELMFYYLTNGNCPHDTRLLELIVNTLFQKTKNKSAPERSFDYIQDSEHIYSAFMQTYHIDLVEEQGLMHWWKFSALLQGLPSNTRFMEIVKIRTQPMPNPTKYNTEERMQLARLKQEYALKVSEEERQNNLKAGFAKMAQSLLAMAKHG